MSVAQELEHIVARHRELTERLIINLARRDFAAMDYDFSALTALGARLDVVTAGLTATISGDVQNAVNVAVAAQKASDAIDLAAAVTVAQTDAQTQIGAAVTAFEPKVAAIEGAANSTSDTPQSPAAAIDPASEQPVAS
jgi:hypothetical protein